MSPMATRITLSRGSDEWFSFDQHGPSRPAYPRWAVHDHVEFRWWCTLFGHHGPSCGVLNRTTCGRFSIMMMTRTTSHVREKNSDLAITCWTHEWYSFDITVLKVSSSCHRPWLGRPSIKDENSWSSPQRVSIGDVHVTVFSLLESLLRNNGDLIVDT